MDAQVSMNQERQRIHVRERKGLQWSCDHGPCDVE